MNLQLKIILASFTVAIISGVLLALSDGSHRSADYFVSFGMVGFVGGLLQIIVGLFLLAKTDKRYARGFLMSGGLLMLVGFATCTSNFNLNIH